MHSVPLYFKIKISIHLSPWITLGLLKSWRRNNFLWKGLKSAKPFLILHVFSNSNSTGIISTPCARRPNSCIIPKSSWIMGRKLGRLGK